MPQPSLELISPRAARPTRTPELLVSFVSIDVTVPGTSSSAGRRALHGALGDALRLYVITIDKFSERVTFRVEVTSRTLDEVIAALTRSFTQATLGRAATTMIRRPRRT
jgi:hypothetical protein